MLYAGKSEYPRILAKVKISWCGQSAGKISVRIEPINNCLKGIDPAIGNYIAGFTDGEGSFNVSVMKRKDYVKKWKIRASFNISQKDRLILERIQSVFECGTLRG